MGDFERFLLVGKGASAATQQCYVRHVQAMLAELCDATGTIDLGRVSAAWVRSYVTRLGDRYAPQSLKLMATAVRSFLRYAWMSGWTAGDLTGAVGPVITHRSGRLPEHWLRKIFAGCWPARTVAPQRVCGTTRC